MNRTPPVEVTDQLRREVGFRCPAQECSSPFLSFHHFDPEWSEEEHHRPEGMIAMCRGHCDMADQGHYTKDQLRAMKERAPPPEFSHPLPWQPESVTFIMGNQILVGPSVGFSLWGTQVLGVSRVELPGRTTVISFSGDFKSLASDPLLRIEKNTLHFTTSERTRIRTTTRARSLDISHDTGSRMCFSIDYLKLSDFKRRVKHQLRAKKSIVQRAAEMVAATGMDSDGRCPVVTITGMFRAPGIKIEATRTRLRSSFEGFPGTDGDAELPTNIVASAWEFHLRDIETPMLRFGSTTEIPRDSLRPYGV